MKIYKITSIIFSLFILVACSSEQEEKPAKEDEAILEILGIDENSGNSGKDKEQATQTIEAPPISPQIKKDAKEFLQDDGLKDKAYDLLKDKINNKASQLLDKNKKENQSKDEDISEEKFSMDMQIYEPKFDEKKQEIEEYTPRSKRSPLDY